MTQGVGRRGEWGVWLRQSDADGERGREIGGRWGEYCRAGKSSIARERKRYCTVDAKDGYSALRADGI